MPGVYAPGAFDIAGTLVGVVERCRHAARGELVAGDVLIGRRLERPAHQRLLAAPQSVRAGCRSIRHLRASIDRWARRCWFRTAATSSVLGNALAGGRVKALAHITGGGLPENLPRVLPDDCDATVRLGSWPVPALFRLVREVAIGLDTYELYRTLNMGVGMVVVCAAADASAVQQAIGEQTWVIGELVPASNGSHRVHLQ